MVDVMVCKWKKLSWGKSIDGKSEVFVRGSREREALNLNRIFLPMESQPNTNFFFSFFFLLQCEKSEPHD